MKFVASEKLLKVSKVEICCEAKQKLPSTSARSDFHIYALEMKPFRYSNGVNCLKIQKLPKPACGDNISFTVIVIDDEPFITTSVYSSLLFHNFAPCERVGERWNVGDNVRGRELIYSRVSRLCSHFTLLKINWLTRFWLLCPLVELTFITPHAFIPSLWFHDAIIHNKCSPGLCTNIHRPTPMEKWGQLRSECLVSWSANTSMNLCFSHIINFNK